MTKDRAIEILFVTAKELKLWSGVCVTLRFLQDVGAITQKERESIREFLYEYYSCDKDRAYWLTDYNDVQQTSIGNSLGKTHRQNILLDAAMYIEIMGLK